MYFGLGAWTLTRVHVPVTCIVYVRAVFACAVCACVVVRRCVKIDRAITAHVSKDLCDVQVDSSGEQLPALGV